MRAALALAHRGEGRTSPNPAVGCVIVHQGRLVGRGWTQPGGRPHAETMALTDAGSLSRGSVAYVTLEPCSHHGKTPPCAQALIDAGIARVVIAVTDPDDRVAGEGVRMLNAAGIITDVGVGAKEVEHFLAGYFLNRLHGRPKVTLKLASSLDGRIALADGTSQWITSATSRRYVHLLRARHDAVLTSSGTLRADNPELTCRLPGLEAGQPLRVLVSSAASLGAQSRLVETIGKGPVLHLHGGGAPHVDGIEDKVLATGPDGSPDLKAVFTELGQRGISSVLIEAGGKFAAALIRQGMVDQLLLFRSPMVIGGDGIPVLSDLGLENLDQGRIFGLTTSLRMGEDTLDIFDQRNTG